MPSANPTPLERLDRLGAWPYPPRVLAVIGTAYFFGFFDVANIGAALPSIKAHFHITTDTASFAITASLLGYVVGAFADAWISDRIGRRQALYASVILFSFGGIVAGLAPTFVWVIVGRAITGMGIGAEIAAVAAYLAEISPAHLRGTANGKAALWGYAAFATVPFVALAIVPGTATGWRWLFLIGGIGGLLILPLRRHLPDSPRWLVERGRESEAAIAVDAAERFVSTMRPEVPPYEPSNTPSAELQSFTGALVLLLIMWFAYYVANYGWITLAPTLLTQHGFSLKGSLGFLCVTGLGYVIGAALSTKISDRYSRKQSICAALAVLALGFIALGALPHSVVIMAAGLLISTCVGVTIPMLDTFTSEQFHDRVRARGVALSNGFGHFGGAIAPWLILPAAAVSFFWGFAVMAGASIVTILLVARGRNITGRAID